MEDPEIPPPPSLTATVGTRHRGVRPTPSLNAPGIPEEHERGGYAVKEEPEQPRFQVRIIDETVKQSARRLAIGALVLLGFLIFLIAAGVLGTWALTSTASNAMPEIPRNQNALTGLPDGNYVLQAEKMTVNEQGCTFEGRLEGGTTGTASSQPASTLLITGNSLAECGILPEGDLREIVPTASRVNFIVTSGVAQIARLES